MAPLEDLMRDIRHAMRSLRRTPGFTAAAVITIGLGVAGPTAVFSVIDPLILANLPVPRPSELVSIRVMRPDLQAFVFGIPPGLVPSDVSRLEFERLRTTASFSSAFLAVRNSSTFGVSGANATEAHVTSASAGFFDTLHVAPVIGRTFIASDERATPGAPVAVISHAFWERAFGQDRAVVGKTFVLIRLGREIRPTIIGVASRGFTGTDVGVGIDVWLAQAPTPPNAESPRAFTWWAGGRMMARLRDGISLRDARIEIERAHASLLQQFANQFGSELTPAQRTALLAQRVIVEQGGRGWGDLRAQYVRPLLVLLGAVGSVLLIACGNVAVLLFARGAARRREMVVRRAIGGGRSRLIRQLLTESLTLTMTGGALGVVIAWWAIPVLLRYAPPLASATLDISLNLHTSVFAFALATLAGLVSGIGPAIVTTRETPGGRVQESFADTSRTRRRVNDVLVTGQLALCLVVLVGGGLFLRTLQNLRNVDTGFDKDRVLRIEFAGAVDHVSIVEELERLAGVESATSWSTGLLAAGVGTVGPIVVPGHVSSDGDLTAPAVSIGPRFFETMGIALIAGRGFRPDDALPDRHPAIVSAAMARHFFGGEDAVGRQFNLSRRPGADVFEVVGVAEDAKYFTLREEPSRTIYFPFRPGRANAHIAVRAARDVNSLAEEVRRHLAQSDPQLVVQDVRTVYDITEAALARERFLAQFGAAIGVLALFLACLGLYGITSYAVTRRTREVGIRMALGAAGRTVIAMFMRETASIVSAGIVVGLIGAIAVMRVIGSLLFGLTAIDPMTIALAVSLLSAATALATFLPAGRAARVDPTVALRAE